MTIPLSYPASPSSFPAVPASPESRPGANPSHGLAPSPLAPQLPTGVPLGSAGPQAMSPGSHVAHGSHATRFARAAGDAAGADRADAARRARSANGTAGRGSCAFGSDRRSAQAIWYVRPPSGGQYGPARGDVMRKWLGEGRVSPDSLVWREGWEDWRAAADAFPSLGAAVTPPMPSPVTPASYAAAATPTHSTAAYRPKRRNSTALAVTIVALLGLMCLALFVTLVLVLLK